MKAIADRLRFLRGGVGYSQKELCQIIGVSQASVNRYELDIITPSPEKLLCLANLYDVSLDYIYGRTDNPQGMRYNYEPEPLKEKFADKEEMRKFIEFCFEPGTAANEKLKSVLADMLDGDEPNKRRKK
jgi:transcriptional regulator with XRE-family HTH domain